MIYLSDADLLERHARRLNSFTYTYVLCIVYCIYCTLFVVEVPNKSDLHFGKSTIRSRKQNILFPHILKTNKK